LGSGILFGPVIGLGIFLARWIPRRLKIISRTGRVLLGTVLGGFLISLAFMLFHILFLGAAPIGPLITMGSLVAALGFSLTNQVPTPVWQKIFGGTASTAAGLSITWLISVSNSASPMLYYQKDQPLQTALLITLFSLVLGAATYALKHSERQEES
jgi:hypothetical protein